MPVCPPEIFNYKPGITKPSITLMIPQPSYADLKRISAQNCLSAWDILGMRFISVTVKEQGDTATAEKILRKIVEAWDHRSIKSQESDWRRLMDAVGDLGGELTHQSRFSEAEKLYKRVLNESVHELDDELDYLTLSTTDNLAIVLQAQGKLVEAEALYRKALQGWLKLL